MLRRLLITWAFNVVAILVAAEIVDGVDFDDSVWTLLAAGIVFTLVNMLVKPIVTLLALPVIIITLGIALFFVNLLMLYVTSWIVDEFTIDSFGAAIAATILIWLVNTALELAFGSVRRSESD
jgi:putative membrane protein